MNDRLSDLATKPFPSQGSGRQLILTALGAGVVGALLLLWLTDWPALVTAAVVAAFLIPEGIRRHRNPDTRRSAAQNRRAWRRWFLIFGIVYGALALLLVTGTVSGAGGSGSNAFEAAVSGLVAMLCVGVMVRT